MRLYLVTDRSLMCGKDLLTTVRCAVEGGVSMVQLREKDCTTREFIELARSLKALLTPYGVPLIVNDRVDVALAAGADGVHVGQADMSVEDVRRLLPGGSIVGLSVENMEQLVQAEALNVDYIGISPVFSTPTKTDTVTEWGLEGLREARVRSRHKLVAIGGVNLTNARQIIDAGADSVAVVSAICSAADPECAARSFMELIG